MSTAPQEDYLARPQHRKFHFLCQNVLCGIVELLLTLTRAEVRSW